MEIPLSRNKVALISPQDYEKIQGFSWAYSGDTNYAQAYARKVNGVIVRPLPQSEVAKLRRPKIGRRFLKQKLYKDGSVRVSVMMHRLIMDFPPNMEVDHINGDRLDNRRGNLRVCTHAENTKNRRLSINNTSGFHGVSFGSTGKRKKRWVAAIRVNGKRITIGRFYTALEAAYAYNKAAKKYHGKYATINNLQDEVLPLTPSSPVATV